MKQITYRRFDSAIEEDLFNLEILTQHVGSNRESRDLSRNFGMRDEHDEVERTNQARNLVF